MQSRRDQVQAQSYVLGRLTSALVMGEPEALDNPHRRIVIGTLIGVLIAALAVAGFAVFGFIKPGGADDWRNPGRLVLEKDIGARYVYVDGQLRPVLNYTSAVFLLGGVPQISSVKSASLRSVPRGLPIGIVGAPDNLPGADGMSGVAWSVCAMTTADGRGGYRATTMLSLDRRPVPPLTPEVGFVARSPAGERFLIWNGRRHLLDGVWVQRVLGFDDVGLDVSTAWLNQISAGPDIGPLPVPGRGEPGPAVDGVPSRVGQVFVAQGAGLPDRYYVLLRDGIQQLTETLLALALGDPDAAASYGDRPIEPVELNPRALASLPRSSTPLLVDGGIPASPPRLPPAQDAGRTWCAQRHANIGISTIASRRVPPTLPVPAGPGITASANTAEATVVAAGVGGLVRPGRAGASDGAALFLVTDAGVKYPLAGSDVATLLGYDATTAVPVEPSLLSLLPTGPVLDPAAARG